MGTTIAKLNLLISTFNCSSFISFLPSSTIMAQGGCMCGNVRYTVEGDPVMKALCHCVDCRKITGSTYSTNSIYPEGGFKVTQGTPRRTPRLPTEAIRSPVISAPTVALPCGARDLLSQA